MCFVIQQRYYQCKLYPHCDKSPSKCNGKMIALGVHDEWFCVVDPTPQASMEGSLDRLNGENKSGFKSHTGH